MDERERQTPSRVVRLQPKPDYRITLRGRDISHRFRPRLESLTLDESRSGESDGMHIVLDDTRGDLALPNRGDAITLAIGWAGKPLIDKGTFIVTEFEHSGAPDQLSISARSAALVDGMQERRDKSWHKVTIERIVETIAARYSLKRVVGAALGQILIDHIDQTSEGDMSFLTRLAHRYDAVMNVKDLHLLFMPIGTGRTASGKPLPVFRIDRAKGDTHRYHVSERENYASVRAHYHSNGKGKRLSVVVGGSGRHNVKVLPTDYANEAEARAAATAEFSRVQRSQATMNYSLALGMPELFPETSVDVVGIKPEIDATPWLVKSARHMLSNDGLTTDLELEMRGDPTSSRHRSHFARNRH